MKVVDIKVRHVPSIRYPESQTEYEITVSYAPNIIEMFLGRKAVVKKYRGDCTVYHEFPSGKRQGTLKEGWLSEITQAYEYSKINND